MSPMLSVLLLSALCVYLWRRGAVTRMRARWRGKRQATSEAFWTGYRLAKLRKTGIMPAVDTSSTADPQLSGACEGGCKRAAVYVWELDASLWLLCEHHSARSAKQLTDLGYAPGLLARVEGESGGG